MAQWKESGNHTHTPCEEDLDEPQIADLLEILYCTFDFLIWTEVEMYRRARLKEWSAVVCKTNENRGFQIPRGVALRLTKNRTESHVFEQQSLKLFATIVSTGFTYKISSQYKGFKFPDNMQL